MTRRLALPLFALSLLVMTGCGSLKRAGKDLAIVATSPVNVPLSATYDSMDWNEHTNEAKTVLLFAPNFALHGVKHVGYTAVHLGDLVLSPFYLLASITPQNDLEPIDLYSLTDGFPWKNAPFPGMEDVAVSAGR